MARSIKKKVGKSQVLLWKLAEAYCQVIIYLILIKRRADIFIL